VTPNFRKIDRGTVGKYDDEDEGCDDKDCEDTEEEDKEEEGDSWFVDKAV